jgi:hypothetical protein
MNFAIRLLFSVIFTSLLSFSGYVGMSMMTADYHSAMTQHSDANCLNQCLARLNIDYIVPAVEQAVHIFALVLIFAVSFILPAYLFRSTLVYGARPRPSPDLNILYERYLI